MDGFKKLLMEKAKEGKFIKPEDAKEKMNVLSEIDDIMGSEMGEKLKGMNKVTIAAPDQESLEEGIEAAGEIVEEMPEMEEESEELSEEEILAKIEELKAMLDSKSEEEDMEDSESME